MQALSPTEESVKPTGSTTITWKEPVEMGSPLRTAAPVGAGGDRRMNGTTAASQQVGSMQFQQQTFRNQNGHHEYENQFENGVPDSVMVMPLNIESKPSTASPTIGRKTIRSRARPRRPDEPAPFLSVDTLPADKVVVEGKSNSSKHHSKKTSKSIPKRISPEVIPPTTGRRSQTPTNPPFSPYGAKSTSRGPSRAGSSVHNYNSFFTHKNSAFLAGPPSLWSLGNRYWPHQATPSEGRRRLAPIQPSMAIDATTLKANVHVSQPFKHDADAPTPMERPVSPSQDMKERTIMALQDVSRALARQQDPPPSRKGGRLLKGKLKPLHTFQLEGPTIDTCQGVQAEERRSHTPSHSRLAQHKRELLSMLPPDIFQGQPRPQTQESIHRTSIDSTVLLDRGKGMISPVMRSDVNFSPHMALPGAPPMGPVNSLVSLSENNITAMHRGGQVIYQLDIPANNAEPQQNGVDHVKSYDAYGTDEATNSPRDGDVVTIQSPVDGLTVRPDGEKPAEVGSESSMSDYLSEGGRAEILCNMVSRVKQNSQASAKSEQAEQQLDDGLSDATGNDDELNDVFPLDTSQQNTVLLDSGLTESGDDGEALEQMDVTPPQNQSTVANETDDTQEYSNKDDSTCNNNESVEESVVASNGNEQINISEQNHANNVENVSICEHVDAEVADEQDEISMQGKDEVVRTDKNNEPEEQPTVLYATEDPSLLGENEVQENVAIISNLQTSVEFAHVHNKEPCDSHHKDQIQEQIQPSERTIQEDVEIGTTTKDVTDIVPSNNVAIPDESESVISVPVDSAINDSSNADPSQELNTQREQSREEKTNREDVDNNNVSQTQNVTKVIEVTDKHEDGSEQSQTEISVNEPCISEISSMKPESEPRTESSTMEVASKDEENIAEVKISVNESSEDVNDRSAELSNQVQSEVDGRQEHTTEQSTESAVITSEEMVLNAINDVESMPIIKVEMEPEQQAVTLDEPHVETDVQKSEVLVSVVDAEMEQTVIKSDDVVEDPDADEVTDSAIKLTADKDEEGDEETEEIDGDDDTHHFGDKKDEGSGDGGGSSGGGAGSGGDGGASSNGNGGGADGASGGGGGGQSGGAGGSGEGGEDGSNKDDGNGKGNDKENRPEDEEQLKEDDKESGNQFRSLDELLEEIASRSSRHQDPESYDDIPEIDDPVLFCGICGLDEDTCVCPNGSLQRLRSAEHGDKLIESADDSDEEDTQQNRLVLEYKSLLGGDHQEGCYSDDLVSPRRETTLAWDQREPGSSASRTGALPGSDVMLACGVAITPSKRPVSKRGRPVSSSSSHPSADKPGKDKSDLSRAEQESTDYVSDSGCGSEMWEQSTLASGLLSDDDDDIKSDLDLKFQDSADISENLMHSETEFGSKSADLEVIARAKPRHARQKTEAPLAPFPPLCFKINARPPPGRLYYFAYGTTMNPARISTYIGSAIDHRMWGILFGFQLKFNKKGQDLAAGGFANIEFCPESSVEGCVYSLTPAQLQSLDMFMGCPEFYTKVVLPVWMVNCSEPNELGVAQYCIPAVMYVAQDKWTHTDASVPLQSTYSIQQCMKGGDLLSPAYKQHLQTLTVSS